MHLICLLNVGIRIVSSAVGDVVVRLGSINGADLDIHVGFIVCMVKLRQRRSSAPVLRGPEDILHASIIGLTAADMRLERAGN